MPHVLDDSEVWSALDPSFMSRLLAAFPEQFQAAASISADLSRLGTREIHNVVVCGMGGSAIGADLVQVVTAQTLTRPLIVHRGYGLPAFVGPHTLFIASSYSGNTEETLSGFAVAGRAGAVTACVTSGGELAVKAATDGAALLIIPPALPPRAALGYSAVMILRCLFEAGLIPDPAVPLQETAEVLRSMAARLAPEVPTSKNPAKRQAALLFQRLAAVYAPDHLAPAAYRWRCQMAENAKSMAWHHSLPEMNHNEVVGWDNPGAQLRQVAVVFLRDCEEEPRMRQRLDWTREHLSAKCALTLEVRSEGESLLARLFSLMYQGDFVSLYLAFLNQCDPSPVTAIESLKQALSRGAEPAVGRS